MRRRGHYRKRDKAAVCVCGRLEAQCARGGGEEEMDGLMQRRPRLRHGRREAQRLLLKQARFAGLGARQLQRSGERAPAVALRLLPWAVWLNRKPLRARATAHQAIDVSARDAISGAGLLLCPRDCTPASMRMASWHWQIRPRRPRLASRSRLALAAEQRRTLCCRRHRQSTSSAPRRRSSHGPRVSATTPPSRTADLCRTARVPVSPCECWARFVGARIPAAPLSTACLGRHASRSAARGVSALPVRPRQRGVVSSRREANKELGRWSRPPCHSSWCGRELLAHRSLPSGDAFGLGRLARRLAPVAALAADGSAQTCCVLQRAAEGDESCCARSRQKKQRRARQPRANRFCVAASGLLHPPRLPQPSPTPAALRTWASLHLRLLPRRSSPRRRTAISDPKRPCILPARISTAALPNAYPTVPPRRW
ncbi:hypothetical protein PSPO01_08371 [Paraphaeosphaeria sporulosa]